MRSIRCLFGYHSWSTIWRANYDQIRSGEQRPILAVDWAPVQVCRRCWKEIDSAL